MRLRFAPDGNVSGNGDNTNRHYRTAADVLHSTFWHNDV